MGVILHEISRIAAQNTGAVRAISIPSPLP